MNEATGSRASEPERKRPQKYGQQELTVSGRSNQSLSTIAHFTFTLLCLPVARRLRGLNEDLRFNLLLRHAGLLTGAVCN